MINMFILVAFVMGRTQLLEDESQTSTTQDIIAEKDIEVSVLPGTPYRGPGPWGSASSEIKGQLTPNQSKRI